MNTNTTPTHPFDLILARDAQWPLVTRDGRKAEVLKWNARPDVYPLIGCYENAKGEHIEESWTAGGRIYSGLERGEDLLISTDYQNPDVRAAVQRAHEKLGMEVVFRHSQETKAEWAKTPGPNSMTGPHWMWSGNDYRLAVHAPAASDIAPGHNPDKLTVSQVGEGWRLLERDEIKDRSALRLEIQQWLKAWDDTGFLGNYLPATYRTRLSREALAAVDKPKTPFDPRNIPGFRPLLPHEQNHRSDFTEADLPEGWRPLLLGEFIQSGDESEWETRRGFGPTTLDNVNVNQWKNHFFRTRRPLPSAPKVVAWDCAEDVPGLICFVLANSCKCPQIVTKVENIGVWCSGGSWYSWSDLKSYSLDRINWKPCTKEVK